MIRKPIVAGSFYEAEPNKLDKQIADCFISKFGPGALPLSKGRKRVYGIIAPHAGYQFSGPCQAWAYKELAEANPAEIYVIIAPNHTSYNGDSIYLADFETPLGLVNTDTIPVKSLLKSRLIRENEMSHLHEHSIEVQLPFLQFINKGKPYKILPLIVSAHSYEICRKIGKAIANLKKKLCIIASSDFTHYGPNYGYVPFIANKKENMYGIDLKAIELIKKLDAKAFFEYSAYKTICGASAITTAIEAVKAMGAEKARLLRYYTSGDIINDYHNAVGYTAMVFE